MAIAPNYTTAGGYTAGQAESTGGGYDPNNPNLYSSTANSIGGAAATSSQKSPSPNYSTAGGWVAGQVESTGGGYDPSTGYLSTTNKTGGYIAVNQPYTSAPAPNYTVVGGWDPNAVGSVGGGYDPDNPSYGNQSNSIGGTPAMNQDYNIAPSYAGGWYGDQVEESGGGWDPSVQGLDDPKNARPGSKIAQTTASATPVTPSVTYQSMNSQAITAADNDWRVRISLSERSQLFYADPTGNNSLMEPLRGTNGVIFPYTPSITVSHIAMYNTATPTHSNYSQHFFNNSEVSDIQVSGEFTVQSMDEGKYLMAAIYFFRSATKMFFGSGTNVGNPPPIVFLDGYGQHYFPHVPCVITNFTHVLPPDVDYVEIPISSTPIPTTDSGTNQQTADILNRNSGNQANMQTFVSKTRVPATSSLSISLKPMYSRKNLHDRFDLNKFAAGLLLRDKVNGLGGFL